MDILLLLSLALAVLISLLAYRVYFHSLAHIPGPPLAKVTYLYEWYYDLYQSDQFTFQLKDLHHKYGPVIRINPDKVHIDDPDFFDQVFNQTNGRAVKPLRVADVFGPYPARLQQAAQTGDMLNMKYIYAAVTLDIINAYCFAHEPHTMDQPDFGRKGFDDVDSFLEMSLLNIHNPWAMRFTYSLPGEFPNSGVAEIYTHQTSLFRTGAYVLRGTAYHIAANPSVRQRLHGELVATIPDPQQFPTLTTLEQLPYLTAVIQEGLRLCDPVTHRISRQLPDQPLECRGIFIPTNTTVGMTAMLTHLNETIFPEPRVFRPEWWLGPDGK
ncbi:Cytochrome P450 [Aspergillus parasiticus SU-1]|uniref:Cytochrome P450 n=1 Tax=Aspergillus parasiticus (strain ATCC 56775 / NRRL 5862 / SRRC 143 / SU-1) TaxID=1403190 RepID=A0A0F0I022_ASPPU|nr:Cytochrome P450 [Aspergillus parasiticus SU-1]